MPSFKDVRLNGPWNIDEIRSHLSGAIIPIRLAVLNGEGWPLVVSLWFTLEEDALWCATPAQALIVHFLKQNERCAFEIAADNPPYKGVRGQGISSIHPDRGTAILNGLLARYSIRPDSRLSRMLLNRADQEVAIRIEAEWMTSWDFSQRMKDFLSGASQPEL